MFTSLSWKYLTGAKRREWRGMISNGYERSITIIPFLHSLCFASISLCLPPVIQWIGLENLHRKPGCFYHQLWGFPKKQLSHHPILWVISWGFLKSWIPQSPVFNAKSWSAWMGHTWATKWAHGVNVNHMIHDISCVRKIKKPPYRPIGNQIADPLKSILDSCIMLYCIDLFGHSIVHAPTCTKYPLRGICMGETQEVRVTSSNYREWQWMAKNATKLW